MYIMTSQDLLAFPNISVYLYINTHKWVFLYSIYNNYVYNDKPGFTGFSQNVKVSQIYHFVISVAVLTNKQNPIWQTVKYPISPTVVEVFN